MYLRPPPEANLFNQIRRLFKLQVSMAQPRQASRCRTKFNKEKCAASRTSIFECLVPDRLLSGYLVYT